MVDEWYAVQVIDGASLNPPRERQIVKIFKVDPSTTRIATTNPSSAEVDSLVAAIQATTEAQR